MNSTITFLRSTVLVLLLLIVTGNSFIFAQPFAGGSGTPADPYQVATDVQFDSIRHYSSSNFIQTANISLRNYRSGDGWLPIPGFSGVYDARGFTITRLEIDRVTSNVGLFSALNGATITNLTITNSGVTGRGVVGILAGGATNATLSNITVSGSTVNGDGNVAGMLLGSSSNTNISDIQITNNTLSLNASDAGGLIGDLNGGSITRSRVTGTNVFGQEGVGGLAGDINSATISESYVIGGRVTGSSERVGGLVGESGNTGNITNSYAQTTVSGRVGGVNPGTGGLVGLNDGTVSNSYAIGRVSGTLAAGLVGDNTNGSITNSYFNSDTTSNSNNNGTGLTTAQMNQSASFTGWDFTNTWTILTGISTFPEFQRYVDRSTVFGGGTGTENDPHLVGTDAQLNSVRSFPGLFYRQTANISLSSYTSGEGWLPIPGFSGGYDGGGFTISRLDIERPDAGDVGLFSALNGANITNLTIDNASVTGRGFVGILAGGATNATLSNITISNATLNSDVSAVGLLLGSASNTNISDIRITNNTLSVNANDVGGLIGDLNSGSITRVRVTGTRIFGQESVGGLAGDINSATVSESYVIGGRVSGSSERVGGLVGESGNTGNIINSYAQTTVSGRVGGLNPGTGGLVGLNDGTVSNSYAIGRVSGTLAAGLVGDNTNGSITNSYFNSDTTSNSNNNGTGLTTAQMRQQASFTGWNFLTLWSIDEGSGFPDFQERQSDELVITGDEGWRMLSSPLSARSIGRLLTPLWTQGFTGADVETGTSNLFFWNEATRTWTLPGDTSFTPGSGTGFLMYVYSDDDFDGTPEGFPKRIEQTGNPFTGERSIDLSFTDTGDSTSDGWNLAGNPYPTSINWNAGRGWGRTNMDQTFYVWSDSASNGNGAYLTWNTLGVGTKGDGKIAPWQGFWVRANAASPRITFSDSVRNSGGVLLKQARTEIPQINFELAGNGLSSKSVIVFHEQAEVGKDPLDAYKLQSLNPQNYLLLGTSVNDRQIMDIQALPFSEGHRGLELVIEGSNLTGEFMLAWSPEYLPEGWAAELEDTKTGERFSLMEAANYTFSLNRAKAAPTEKVSENEPGLPNSPITPVIKSKAEPSRFLIHLSLAVSSETDPELPQQVELQQNYPNPFNPGTTINYQLPRQSRVRLEVFDMLGRKVATLLNERVEAGYHQVRFDARNLASGMYIYRLQAGSTVVTKKLTLIK